MNKTLRVALVAALPLSSLLAAAAPATSATTVTQYAQSTRTQYLFPSAAGGVSAVGALHGGDTIVGEPVGTDWLKITVGPNAGKYVWKASATPTPKPIATNVTRYTGTSAVAQSYEQAATTSSLRTKYAPVVAVKGDLYANGWFQQRDTAWNYMQNTMGSNPYSALETRQWNNTTGYQAMAPTSQTVLRYAVLNRVNVPVRSGASTTSTIMARVPAGTALSGQYINSHWFKVTSGPQAGRYVSSGVLFTAASQATINGKLAAADLCQVPDAMRLSKDIYDRDMGCESLHQLIALDAKLKASVGTGVKQWDAYRTFATQQEYYKRYGAGQAAVPGTSNHGLGNALDMRYTTSGTLSWTTPTVVNFTKYGKDYGWVKPAYLMKTAASNGEPWHFEYNG